MVTALVLAGAGMFGSVSEGLARTAQDFSGTVTDLSAQKDQGRKGKAGQRDGGQRNSADCIKDYTALKKKSDVQAKTKKQKLPVEQKDSPLLVKAQECVEIARAEAKSFLAKPFTTRYSYKRERFSDACELARDGADIVCWVVPAYRQCVQHFSYSPKQCQKLDGKTAQPCCHLKRTRGRGAQLVVSRHFSA